MKKKKISTEKRGIATLVDFFYFVSSKARESPVILPPLLIHIFSCGRAGQYLYVVQFNGHSNILNDLFIKVLTYQAVVERYTGNPVLDLLSYKQHTLKQIFTQHTDLLKH